MPALSNPKRERFAQELAKGRPAYVAHKTAGFSGDRGHASKLQRQCSIVQRVEEIMLNKAEVETEASAVAAAALAIDKQWLMERANEARELAMRIEQPSGAVAAIKELGILSGLRVEKRDHTHRGLSDLSDDELADIALGGGEGDIAPPRGSTLSH